MGRAYPWTTGPCRHHGRDPVCWDFARAACPMKAGQRLGVSEQSGDPCLTICHFPRWFGIRHRDHLISIKLVWIAGLAALRAERCAGAALPRGAALAEPAQRPAAGVSAAVSQSERFHQNDQPMAKDSHCPNEAQPVVGWAPRPGCDLRIPLHRRLDSSPHHRPRPHDSPRHYRLRLRLRLCPWPTAVPKRGPGQLPSW